MCLLTIFGLGPTEIILILLLLLLLFGATAIPKLLKGIGNGVKEFNAELNDDNGQKKQNAKDNS
jgi:sec-independent protein translocase protein TatA